MKTVKKNTLTAWEHEPTQADENQMIEGIGRAGTATQPSNTPGMSHRSVERIRELGSSRIRINRPGKIALRKRQK